MRNINGEGFPKKIERGCEGKSIRKSRVKVIGGAFLYISAWGYILIPFSSIVYVTEGYNQSMINHINTRDELIDKVTKIKLFVATVLNL